jgi:hypothetical protein
MSSMPYLEQVALLLRVLPIVGREEGKRSRKIERLPKKSSH